MKVKFTPPFPPPPKKNVIRIKTGALKFYVKFKKVFKKKSKYVYQKSVLKNVAKLIKKHLCLFHGKPGT